MKSRTIRLMRRKGVRLNFHAGMDRLAGQMAMWGFSGRCIATTCGFRSPSLVYYRNKRLGIRISDWRNGTSPMAVMALGRMRQVTKQVFDAHLEQREGGSPRGLKVKGIRMQVPAAAKRALA